MTLKQRIGLGAAPLLMRLTLGVVFLWAGSSKLFWSDTYAPEQAAALANLGIISLEDTPAETPVPSVPEEPDVPLEREVETDDAAPIDESIESDPSEEAADEENVASMRTVGTVILVQNETASAPEFTAADFPEGVKARRLYSLSLLLDMRAHPAEGSALWPSFLANDTMLMLMPWLAAITEFVGGVFLMMGLLTRLTALSLTGTMVSAMALTTIGPAITSGAGFWGFLPDPMLGDASAWVGAWQPMLFQLTTLVIAFSLVLTGAGWLSLDCAIFAKRLPREAAEDS